MDEAPRQSARRAAFPLPSMTPAWKYVSERLPVMAQLPLCHRCAQPKTMLLKTLCNGNATVSNC